MNPKTSNDAKPAVAGTDLAVELSLKQAIELAYSNAVGWDKRAKLFSATSADNDKGITGVDGKRRYWNIFFGIPDTNRVYLVQTKDEKIKESVELTSKGDSPQPKKFFIENLLEIKFDTPELLKKAKKITDLYPGKTWAKGYNFGISKDAEKNVVLIEIIGWNKKRDKMRGLQFNANTGELYLKTEGDRVKRRKFYALQPL